MVDEVEFDIMDADENRDVPVVIRWFGNYWGICHAKSYQNAFRASTNKFENREDAVKFAENNDCVVVFHDYNRLQAHTVL